MSEEALRLEAVTHQYGRGFQLKEMTLSLDFGSVVGIIGPNGSGKTTALHIAAGLLQPRSGDVTVHGYSLDRYPVEAKSRFSFVPDAPAGFDHLTVLEYCGLYGALRQEDRAYEDRAAIIIDLIGLSQYRHRQLGKLSHGTRRKVAMTAGFASAAPVLMLDEATSALDPESILVLRALVADRRRCGGAVLVATQDLHFAREVCDGIVLLVDGTVADSGEVAEVLARHSATDLFEVFGKVTGLLTRLDDLHETLHTSLSI